jgi:hypothetical protein
MASCFADLGEYVKAIEWQKRAWLLSYKTNTYAVYILCLYNDVPNRGGISETKYN